MYPVPSAWSQRHGTARHVPCWPGKCMARHGTRSIGTARHWHGTVMARHGRGGSWHGTIPYGTARHGTEHAWHKYVSAAKAARGSDRGRGGRGARGGSSEHRGRLGTLVPWYLGILVPWFFNNDVLQGCGFRGSFFGCWVISFKNDVLHGCGFTGNDPKS